MTTALITGATAGIGRAFADLLAARGHDLVLVARDAERLEVVARELEHRFGAAVEVLDADLADRAQLQRVIDRCTDEDRAPIDVLVSNAGFTTREPFVTGDPAGEEAMLDVLVRAPLLLTRAVLPGMLERDNGRIITVSSIAANAPGGTYSAAKAWASMFSEGLQPLVRGTGVHVTALEPGYTRTEFHERASLDVSGLPEQLWLDADDVAAQGWADCEAGRALSVPGAVYRGGRALLRVAPRPWVRAALAKGPRPRRP